MQTSNPQINHMLKTIEHEPIPHTVLATIALLVDECNHKDKLIDALTAQIPG